MPLATIVEDDEGIRESLQVLLEDEGYCVTTFPSGTAALTYLRTQSARHVVLTDYLMPGISGAEFLQQALEHWHLQQHCYIMLAARPIGMVDAQGQAILKRWKIPYIKKPFQIDEVLTTVAACQQ